MPAERIDKAKSKINDLQKRVSEKVALQKLYAKQLEQLKKKAADMGIQDLNSLKAIISENEQKLEDLERQMNDIITQAEAVLTNQS